LVYNKKKIVVEKSPEAQVNDRIRQLQTEAEAVSCTYSLNEYDIAELVFDKYVEKFPDTHYVDIHRMMRIKVGNTAQNYLVYYTQEEVTDSVQFKKKKFNRKRVGFHPIISGEASYDSYGTLTGYDIGTPKCSFDIPFNPDNVRKIIAAARSGPRELLIAKGATMGENPLAEPPISIPNLQNILFADFDLLAEAGRLHYLNTGSGYDEFLKVRATNLSHGADIQQQSKKENGDKEK
jgi:hypothetical protein